MALGSTTPTRAKPRWKRWIRIVSIVVLAIVGLPAGLHFYLRWSAGRNLQYALAEADRLDPGWRLEELEEKREIVPDEENGALKVLAVKELMPRDWPNRPRFLPMRGRAALQSEPEITQGEEQILRLPPEAQLPPEILRELQSDLKNMAVALPEARTLVQFPRGRYSIQYPLNLMDTVLLSKEALTVAKLLWADGIVAAQDQQIDQALASARCVLNAARSIGDEPMVVSQELRLAIERLAILTVERTLAQGQPSRQALEATQQLLEDEAAQPLLLHAYRAHRAGTYRHLAAVESGAMRYRMRFYRGPLAQDLPDSWCKYLDMVIVRRAHSAYLRLLTALVEIAKLPAEEQPTRIRHLDDQARPLQIEFQAWFQSNAQMAELFQKNQAWLRCAAAALAVERYRLAHGHWPDSLAKSEFLREVPTDPYDSQPLHFRRLQDGVVIYSIGPDGVDDGGKLERNSYTTAGTDLGFQLWDVNCRRQPWRPPPKTDKDDNN